MTRRDWTVLILLLSLLTIWSLSPFVSDWVPTNGDAVPVIGLVVQMEMALLEGQFPPRVAPFAIDGWRYPVYQFYSPFPYTLFGLTAHVIPEHNPWIAVQIVMFLALLSGGIAMFRLALEIVGSPPAAVIAACAYITAPYLLINMHARGAMAEAFAQAILPIAALFFWRATRVPTVPAIAKAAVAAAMLFLSHLITGAYFMVAFSLILAVETLFMRHEWKRLAAVPLVAIGAALLAAYYFLPLIHNKELLVGGAIGDPSGWSFITTFFRLLAPTSLAPALDGGGGTPNVNPAIGIPTLTGFLLLAIRLIQSPPEEVRAIRPLAVALFSAIFLFFIFTWSPFDVWKGVPSIFYVVQFTYRLLAQIQWMGVLCLALGLAPSLKPVNLTNPLPLVAAAVLCVLASSSYITVSPRKTSVAEHVRNPEIGYGGDMYTRSPDIPGPRFRRDGTKPIFDMAPACRTVGSIVRCTIQLVSGGIAQMPVLYYPNFLDVRVNGQPHAYGRLSGRDTKTVDRDLVALELGGGQSTVTAEFVGSSLGNWISLLSICLLIAGFAVPAIQRRRAKLSSNASSADNKTPPRRKKT